MMKSLLVAALAAVSVAATPVLAQTTGTTGGGAPIENRQPSIVLNQVVAMEGIFPCRECGGASAANTIGMVHTFAGNFNPFGMPSAQGQLVPISQNTALFALLGTAYGGNGQTNFALPDLTGRAAIGMGAHPGGSNFDLGEVTGDASNIMTLGQLPAHAHGLPGGGSTGVTGGNTPLDNIQPSLGLNYQIAVNGPFGGADPFLGQIAMFGGNFDPGGFMQADGRLLSISQYGDLFDVIGTTYGGDGQTTFALPDLRGRVAVGAGNGVALGETFGSEQTFLTEGNLPSHDHTLPGGGFTLDDGGGQPFDNAQPSLGVNYLISLNGIFPSRDGCACAPDIQYYGEVVAFAGVNAPQGWAFANGQLLSISQNTALFAILGTTYGGDGRTTFALPDLRGRTILGMGGDYLLGQVYGERETTLTVAQLAPHDHTLPDGGPGGPGVPEPATWALLIGGFGLAGAVLRRRRFAAA